VVDVSEFTFISYWHFLFYRLTTLIIHHFITLTARRHLAFGPGWSTKEAKRVRCWRLMNWTDLKKSTQLHDAFIGHARQRHAHTAYWLDAAAKLGRLVLDQLWTRVFQSAWSRWSSQPGVPFSSVKLICCELAFSWSDARLSWSQWAGQYIQRTAFSLAAHRKCSSRLSNTRTQSTLQWNVGLRKMQ